MNEREQNGAVAGSRSRGLAVFILFAIFLLLAGVFTRNVISHLSLGPPCGAGDAAMFTWNFWWVAEQLKHGELFFKCNSTILPFGIRTVYHTLIPLHCVVFAPVTWLFGPIVSTNLNLILSLAIGALGMGLVVKRLTGSHIAALCGGIAYAFSTTHWYHAIGHFNFTSVELLPLCLLFLIRWIQDGRALNLAVASGFLGLNLYVDYTTTIILGLCSLPLFVLGGVRGVRRSGIGKAGLTLIPATFVFAAITAPVGYYAREFSSLFDSNWGGDCRLALGASPDLLSYVLPDGLVWYAPLSFRSGIIEAIASGGLDRPQFFGLVALVLASWGACSLAKRDRGLLFALLAGLVICVAVSLGPEPRVMGAQFIPDFLSPYRLLTSLPVLGTLRIPGRFGLGVVLVGGVLVGLGAAKFFSKPRPKEAGTLLALLVVGLLFAERVHVPILPERIETPALYEALDTLEPPPYGVVIVPFCVWSGQGVVGQFSYLDPAIVLFYQTEHHVPTVNGNASRIPREIEAYYRQAPLTSSLMALQSGRAVDVEQIRAEGQYAEEITWLFGISHILCDYRANYWEAGLPMRSYIEEILRGEKVYEDETGRIYQLPLLERPPSELLITPEDDAARLYVMEGWHEPFVYEGEMRLIFDPFDCCSRGKSRLRLIFRNAERSEELEWSLQLAPAFPDAFRPVVFGIDLDGKETSRAEVTDCSTGVIGGSFSCSIEPGLHYFTLTPLSPGCGAARSSLSAQLPFGLSDRSVFVEQLKLNW